MQTSVFKHNVQKSVLEHDRVVSHCNNSHIRKTDPIPAAFPVHPSHPIFTYPGRRSFVSKYHTDTLSLSKYPFHYHQNKKKIVTVPKGRKYYFLLIHANKIS